MDKNDKQYQRYMQEVEQYLTKVRNGRRVAAVDPQAPQYSQPADDLRLMQRGEAPAGYGATPAPLPTHSDKGFGQAFETPAGQSPPYGFGNQPGPMHTMGDYLESIRKSPMVQHPIDTAANYVKSGIGKIGEIIDDPVGYYKRKYGFSRREANPALEERIGQEVVSYGSYPVSPKMAIRGMARGDEFDQAAAARATTNLRNSGRSGY